jgi:serine/threonine protein kinase
MDKYQIIKIIGEGNYGKAVLVKNIYDKILYVVKVNIVVTIKLC